MKLGTRVSSLRWRLPLLILTLLASIGLAFTWLAYYEVRHTLRIQGDQRLGNAASQLAETVSQAASARIADARRLAADPGVMRFAATGERPEDAVVALENYIQRNPQTSLTLTARGGVAAIRIERGPVTLLRTPEGPADTAATNPADRVGPLQLKGGRVIYETIAAVGSPTQPGASVGFVSIERPLSAASGAALVERLLGSDATLKFGNTAGDLWTDLSAPVRAPPPAAPTSGAISFVAVPGDLRMGRSVAVAGTPWDVWVDFSEASLMEPARILLWRLLPSTLLLIVLGVVAVGSVSARITRPLQIVAEAADAIASGDYSRRVDVEGRDEVARLGSAFNLMATRFAESHDALEARVQARTAELERAREELDQFFSMSPDLLCIADKRGQFTRVNPAWEQALGWTAAELTSVPFLDLVHPDDAESTARETAMVANGGAASNFENRYRTKDGSYRWLSWKAAGRLDGGPMYAAARDVTEQKRAARELHHYAAELTAANHELEAFSYSVSHDLRSPLRSIDGFSQALLEDCGDQLGAEGEGHLRRIRAAAQHMGQLIDDLLKLARVTRADLRFQRIDLSAMAEAKLRALAVAEPDRTVEWRVAPGLHTVGDARLLEVAMTNLIENAWKFTGRCEEARIEFGATDGKGRREYFVKDNGAGFEAAYAGKLFGAFQRLHHANEFQGTGIGLATVQRILTRHGGHIRAEGAVGHGATFWFTLQPESRV